MRRAFDLLLVLPALFIATPLILFAAIGIAVSNRGPILYCAYRTGRTGRPFKMYKLRTMHHKSIGAPIALVDDPRVFKFGKILRALRIDELPQLVNILRGDMAFVGPRPEDPEIVKRAYEPWMQASLEMRPGLTGPGTLYALNAGVDTCDPVAAYEREVLPKRLAIDIAYAARATVLSDAAYLLKTAQTLIAIASNRPPPALSRLDLGAIQQGTSGR